MNGRLGLPLTDGLLYPVLHTHLMTCNIVQINVSRGVTSIPLFHSVLVPIIISIPLLGLHFYNTTSL